MAAATFVPALAETRVWVFLSRLRCLCVSCVLDESLNACFADETLWRRMLVDDTQVAMVISSDSRTHVAPNFAHTEFNSVRCIFSYFLFFFLFGEEWFQPLSCLHFSLCSEHIHPVSVVLCLLFGTAAIAGYP